MNARSQLFEFVSKNMVRITCTF